MRRGTIGGVVLVKKVANMQEHSVMKVDWAVAVNIGGAIFWLIIGNKRKADDECATGYNSASEASRTKNGCELSNQTSQSSCRDRCYGGHCPVHCPTFVKFCTRYSF